MVQADLIHQSKHVSPYIYPNIWREEAISPTFLTTLPMPCSSHSNERCTCYPLPTNFSYKM